MSFFAQSTPAPRPKTKNVQPVSLFFAGLLMIMVVAQLFTFESFPDVIRQMRLPEGEIFAPLRATLLVIFEIAALPFLLSMQLSPAARAISMVAGWIVVAGWTFAALWINLVVDTPINSGFLGATISLASGWWMLFFSLALGVLAVWSAWGMWPLGRSQAK